MQSTKNIIFVIAGAALAIVILACVGRWSMDRAMPSVPDTGGNDGGLVVGTTTTIVSTSPTQSSTRVTQSDSGKTVTLKVGTQFLLDLGSVQNWSVAISDATVVRQVPNASAAQGTQGLFEALRTGTTTMSAEGRPICHAGEMCAQYIINFSTIISGV